MILTSRAGIISRIRDNFTHYVHYLTSAEYRQEERTKNSDEWREAHKDPFEGIERELGIDRRTVDIEGKLLDGYKEQYRV